MAASALPSLTLSLSSPTVPPPPPSCINRATSSDHIETTPATRRAVIAMVVSTELVVNSLVGESYVVAYPCY